MSECVFMVVASAPSAVMASFAGVMQSAGFQAVPGADAGSATFIDDRAQHATVTTTLRRDRFGTVVSVRGAPPKLGSLLVRELQGVSAPPPIGPPAGGEARAAAVAEPLDDHTRPRHAKRPARTVALRFDDGRMVRLEARMLLGRDPSPPPGPSDVALVPIEDRDLVLSKTHAAIEVQRDRVMVQDLGSTNGTLLVGADGRSRVLQPREPEPLEVGDIVVFGQLRATLVQEG